MTPTPDADARVLEALANRCEKAAGPSRELDARIYCALHGRKFSRPYGNDFAMWVDGVPHEVKIIDRYLDRYTASLDAALTLVPRGAAWTLHSKPETVPTAGVTKGGAAGLGIAATSSLAMVVACLRMLAAAAPPPPTSATGDAGHE